jgi:hypothetical protein
MLRGAHPAAWLATFGTILIVGFVTIRASSFHHMDRFIDSRFLMLRWNWLLEIGGISLVLAACVWRTSAKSGD